MGAKGTAFSQTEQYQLGRTGERIVAEVLETRGWYILPCYDYSGEENNKAPRLCGISKGYVLPDLLVAKGGTARWVEVKTKSKPTFTLRTGTYEHGISLAHYEDYLKVQEITGSRVWLSVYEISTGVILCGLLDELSDVKRCYIGTKMGCRGMVFFPRDAFKCLAVLSDN